MHARTALVALLLFACVRNPATGKLQLDLLPEGQEVQMGQEAKKQTEESIGLYEDQKIQQYVAELGKPLAAQTGRNVPFSYEVVDDNSVNAFALPGGPVFITRGILGYLNSEAQLVAVIGHETGHVAARHSANQLSKAELAQVGLGISQVISPAIATLGQVAGAGLQVLFLKYSRDDENQADALGFRYMTNVGYDPKEMLSLFDMLQGVTDLAGAAGKLPEWQQTHPIPEHRHENAQKWINDLKVDISHAKVEREKYLKTIDGIVFGENPKNGYFKGDRFIHPGLKFQFNLPSGWKHQNQPEAVVAVSPQQDAMVQLQAAGKMTPEDAAQKFYAQQGIQKGQVSTVSINGHHAVVGAFGAQSQQGAIEGLVSFIDQAGTCFVLAGYTGQGGGAKYESTFKSVIQSFNNVTDSGELNVQPARIKLVTLGAPMSVSQFLQQYPSTAKPEVVALINGAKKDGTIPAGLAKQVVGGQGNAE